MATTARIVSPPPTRVLVLLEGNAATTQPPLPTSETQETVKDEEMLAPAEGNTTDLKGKNDLSKTTALEEEAMQE